MTKNGFPVQTMRLFHGSAHVISKPAYGSGKAYNDYGRGFYCTKSPEMAKEWAVREGTNGFANEYLLHTEGLSLLDLTEYSIFHWLAILLENRTVDYLSGMAGDAKDFLTEHYRLPYRTFDVICGYRADDSYFSFAQDFLNGVISVGQLERAMYLGELGVQYMIRSRKAFAALEFVGQEPAPARIWGPRRRQRDEEARREYFDRTKNHVDREGIYILDLIRQEG